MRYQVVSTACRGSLYLPAMTAARSASMPENDPIERRPVEWDFRWIGSEDEADHAYLLELTREVIRQAEMRLGKPKQKKALMELVEAMSVAAAGFGTLRALAAILRLEKANFMLGVMTFYATAMGGSAGRLPAAFAKMKKIRSAACQPKGGVIGISKLTSGKPYTPFSLSEETYHLLRMPKHVTANRAKHDFGIWADANLPASKVPLGGRPDKPSLKLLRLAFYRFDQAWEHPRPYAGFAVAVRANARGTMAPAFTEFGNDWYEPFMQPNKNQPKSATWSESVKAAKLEIDPLVEEVLSAASLLA